VYWFSAETRSIENKFIQKEKKGKKKRMQGNQFLMKIDHFFSWKNEKSQMLPIII